MTAEHIEDHELAALFPLMTGDDFAALVKDVEERGLEDPIVLLDGKILDGRNRYRACREANVSVRFVDFDGDDPLAYVISHNLHRRHLTESQRAMAAAKVANMRRGGDRGNQYTGGKPPIGGLPQDGTPPTGVATTAPPISQAEAAQMFKVGTSSVQRAAAVRDRGVPELVAAVERGEASVNAAVAVATLPEEEQRAVVATGDVKRAVRERRREPEKRFEITAPRHEQIANRAYERFGTVLGGLAGYRDGLETFDVRPVLAVARPDEIEEWIRTLSDVISVAKRVQSALKEGM